MKLTLLLQHLAVFFFNYFIVKLAFLGMMFPADFTFVMGLTGIVLLVYFDARYVQRQIRNYKKKAQQPGQIGKDSTNA